MKRLISARIIAAAFFVTAAIPVAITAEEPDHPRYTLIDLGTVGGPPGQPYAVNNRGVVAGAAATQKGAVDAILWFKGLKLDLGRYGLGGPNSEAFGVNESGEAVGAAQTLDPNYEDFCGFNAYGLTPSNTTCVPFLWQDGVMNPLPTLGGPNGTANMINRRGESVGFAETQVQDPNCPVFEFKPVSWKNGTIQQLATAPGDPYGIAAWINDRGQVVGSSGTCAPFNPQSGLYLTENHALLWENGIVTDLGNLGGTGANAGNHSCAINNHGQIVGHSELPNDTTFHGFLWTRETHMQDLGTLSGDFASLANGINDRGQIVGASIDSSFNLRAILWQNGVMTDLNTLLRGKSNLSLQVAQSINDRGEIVGFGITSTGETHGFLAIPCDRDHDAENPAGDTEISTEPSRPVLSESARPLLRQQLASRYNFRGLQ